MTKAAAGTGGGPTFMVAVEQYFPKDQRLFEDALAARILPPGLRIFARLMRPKVLRDWLVRTEERLTPGIWGGIGCRKRYIDEKLIESLPRVETVVNLGAGFDTRAFRLPELANVPIWEVDQPENITGKQARLIKLLGAIPSHIHLAPIDFDREELSSVLAANGWPADVRTFFIWEGVTQYLSEDGIRKTFEFLARAASGSRLAFTFVRKDFVDGQNLYGQQMIYRRYVASGIWRYGMRPEGVADIISEYGWRVLEHLGAEELAERYVRPTGRLLTTTPIERMVFAEKI